MRKAASIFGLVWMGAVAIAGTVLMTAGKPLGNGRGFIYLLFGAALPGILSYRWSRRSEVREPGARARLAPKAPFDAASEAGHVMRLNAHPSAADPEQFQR